MSSISTIFKCGTKIGINKVILPSPALSFSHHRIGRDDACGATGAHTANMRPAPSIAMCMQAVWKRRRHRSDCPTGLHWLTMGSSRQSTRVQQTHTQRAIIHHIILNIYTFARTCAHHRETCVAVLARRWALARMRSFYLCQTWS